MTIKELENRTGMARANIRFYEGEGLLAPKRLDNGYRDYSEEDARTLEKIKLLRQLQLDIDTIRKVQRGTLTLEQALFTQLTRLEGDRTIIERAAQVCRELERSGVEYAALEPQPWLEQLDPPERPALPGPSAPAPVEDARDAGPRACYHPWQRYFARALDMSLYKTLITVVYLVLTRDQGLLQFQASGLGGWVWNLGLLVFTLAVEPLWLHFWGWTPGKWVFGLKLRDENGNKLSLAQARARCWRLGGDGYGWNIPIWDLWRMWQCRKMGLDGQDCPWDGEEGYRYTKVERRIHGGWICGAVLALCSVAMMLVGSWSMLPPCRGDLSVAEFSRNYNHVQDLLYSADGYAHLPVLDGQGQWVEEESTAKTETLIDGVWVDEEDIKTRYDPPEFTVDNGRVTAVTFHMESADVRVSSGIRESVAFLAMSGAVDGLNLFNYNMKDWAQTADQVFWSWEDREVDCRGLHISQHVEYEGYETGFGDTLWHIEGEDRHCEKTVTISLIE